MIRTFLSFFPKMVTCSIQFLQPPSQDSLSSGDISMLDEATKHLMERQETRGKRHSDDISIPSIRNTPPSGTESTDQLSIPRTSLSVSSPNLSNTPPPPPPLSIPPINTTLDDHVDEKKPSVLRTFTVTCTYTVQCTCT